MNKYAKVTFRASIILWTIVFLLMCTSGCSALTGLATDAAIGAVAKDDPLLGIDTEIVAGDKQGIKSGPDTKLDDVEVNGNLTTSTIGRKTDVSGTTDTLTINEGVPFWWVLVGMSVMLLLGLFIPQFKLTRK
ncbi:hypothetical protein ABMA70_15885 [Halobacteriovorax sp. XZX-3]|uniref:Uncharacterized protein n=1 Tax=Vibrio phage VpV262 TaxID=2907796 RepID=Q8LT38_9CAUD|nr:hypothetical protein VpV262p66 [Vibrio phage VpV262]AAM28393.1 hypothetical protein [Vibrio phage VpV262]